MSEMPKVVNGLSWKSVCTMGLGLDCRVIITKSKVCAISPNIIIDIELEFVQFNGQIDLMKLCEHNFT